MTQAELKRLIKEQKQKIEEVKDEYQYDSEHKELGIEISKLRMEIAQREKRRIEIKIRYKEDNEDILRIYKDDLDYYKELLREKQENK